MKSGSREKMCAICLNDISALSSSSLNFFCLFMTNPSYPKKSKTSTVIKILCMTSWLYPSTRLWLGICRKVRGNHEQRPHTFFCPCIPDMHHHRPHPSIHRPHQQARCVHLVVHHTCLFLLRIGDTNRNCTQIHTCICVWSVNGNHCTRLVLHRAQVEACACANVAVWHLLDNPYTHQIGI